MKDIRFIFGGILLFAGAGCLLLAFLSFRDTESGVLSQALKDQKRYYNKGEYTLAYTVSEFLVDSLKVTQDEVRLNYANAAYLCAMRDSSRSIYLNPADTITGDVKNFFTYMNTALTTTKNLAAGASRNVITSTAYNHMGVILCKNLSEDQPEEKVLEEASGYFRNALQQDSDNEFARFNYELIRRKIEYPEMVIAQVKSLINQRRYRQARLVLDRGVHVDERVKKNYGDFVERIDNIIKIDSLSRS
jgi:hypothetical protein